MLYFKFSYSAGYVGTDRTDIVAFEDSANEDFIKECYDEWYAEVDTGNGSYKEIMKADALQQGVDIEY